MDLYSFVDPSPLVEQQVLKKAQAQLDLILVFDQVATGLSTAAKHLSGLNETVKSITSALKPLDIGKSLIDMLLQLGSVCELVAKAILSQCMITINILKTIHIPAVEKSRNEFAKQSSESSKRLEEWGAAEPRVRPELAATFESALEAAMCQRAGHLYELAGAADRIPQIAPSAVAIALTSFLAAFSHEFGAFFAAHTDAIKELTTAGRSQAESFNRMVEPAAPSDVAVNQAFQLAQRYWAVRRGQVVPSDELARPSGLVWLHRRAFASSWARRFCVLGDGVLTSYDPASGAKDVVWPLMLVQVVPVPRRDRRFVLKIQGPNETLVLQALTQYDFAEWTKVLTGHNEKVILGSAPAPAAEAGESDPSDGVTRPTVCADCGATDAS
jgi:hypothetical protein